VQRSARASVNLTSADYALLLDWYRVVCQQGVMPTNMVEPTGVEGVWRFVSPPVADWDTPGSDRVNVTAELEQLPGWAI
jgi:hypothetical protein